jgi:hypothetical protein
MIIHFPAYRGFNETRINTNDCMMAMLVSSDVSIDRLGELNENPAKRLPEILSHLDHVSRVNLTPLDAITLIRNSENVFVSMAISQTIAVHEHFLRSVAKILLDNHFSHSRVDLHNFEWASIVHILNFLQVSCNLDPVNTNWVLYDYIRNIRNRIAHAKGEVDSSIDYAALSQAAQTEWERLAGRPLSVATLNNHLSLKSGELIAVLSIANNTAKYVNEKLALTIPKSYWTQVIIDDFKANHQNEPLDTVNPRKVYKYCEMYYEQLHLTHTELDAALAATYHIARN